MILIINKVNFFKKMITIKYMIKHFKQMILIINKVNLFKKMIKHKSKINQLIMKANKKLLIIKIKMK